MSSEVYGVTIPLLVDQNGNKYGKSSGGGALWLDPDKTSPYQLYQFFMNVADSEVESLLKRLTFLRLDDIKIVMDEHNILPDNRVAQRKLAATVTEMVHGTTQLKKALGDTQAFFDFDWKNLKNITL